MKRVTTFKMLIIFSIVLGGFQLKAQINLNNGLVAFYPLNGNTTDISGNGNNGTPSGNTTYIADRFGNPNSAISFGGTGSPGKVTIPHSASLNFSAGATFTFWARISSNVGTFGNGSVGAGGWQCFFAKEGDAGGGLYQLNALSGNNLNTGIGNNGVPHTTSIYSPYNINQWINYTVTMDATGHYIYVNGVLHNSNTDAANFVAMVNRNLVLGRFNSNWYPLNGALDDFRVYNRVLTNDEIVALANDDLGSISITHTGPSTYCAGAPLSVDYNATGDFLANNTFTLQMSNASGSFANPIPITTVTPTSGTINTFVPTGTPSGSGYRFRIISALPVIISDTTNTVTVNAVIGDIPNPAIFRYIGNVNGKDYYRSLNNQTWANAKLNCANNGGHLATIENQQVNDLIHRSGTSNVYIGLTDVVTEGLFIWENNMALGYTNWNPGEPNNSGNEDYVELRADNGRWNDVPGTGTREYILELNPAGLNQGVCVGTNINLNATTLAGASYSWSGPNGFSSTQQNPVIPNASLVNSGAYALTYSLGGCSLPVPATQVHVNILPNNVGQNFTLPPTLNNGLILHYPLNGNAQDASGNGNNGSIVSGVTAAADRFGNTNSALQFNGSNGHIAVPSGVYFDGNDFTVTAWVRKNSNNNHSRLFDFGNGSPNNNVILAITDGTSGRPFSNNFNNTTSVGRVTSPSGQLAINQWQLITYTWSDNSGRIYVNGELVAQDMQTPVQNVVRNLNYIARSNWSGDGYANSRFDDFRIYNRVLSESEIQAMVYNQPENLSISAIPTSGICTGNSSQVIIVNSQPGISYQMRNATTLANVGVAQIGTGDTVFFNTGILINSTSFDFIATVPSTGCSITLSPEITVNVNPLPSAPISTNDTVCNQGVLTISVSGGATYNWYETPTGGSPLASITGNSHTTGNINVSEHYYVSTTDANGCESPRTQVSAVVINPLNPPVDILSDLILHYKFDGNLDDSSGNGYNATITGTNSYVNDKHGNSNSAINSTATGSPGNNWISAGNPAKVQQLTNQVTISAWIRQTQTWFGSSGNDGQMPLINKWDGGTGMWVGLRMQNPTNMSNRVRWRVNGSTFIESNTNVPVGTWHHIVCTYNGAQLRIYQNGVLTGTLNHTGTIGNTGVNLMLGRQANGTPSGGITYRGDWDEVKIYNRSLNQSEIQTLFNNESVAFATSPLCDGEGDLALTTFNFPGASYNWTGPNGFTSNSQNPPVILNADSATYAGTYTLLVTAQGCTSLPQTVDAIIYQTPNAPTTINDTICGSGNATLSAMGAPTGASYRWYTVATGGTPIGGQTSSTITINNVTVTTHRYVSIVRNGCEGPRTQVTAVYYSNVLTNLAVMGSSVCDGNSSATVSVNASESGVNYQVFMSGNPISSIISGGGNITIPVNTSGMSIGNNTVSIQATQPGCGAVALNNTATITIFAPHSVNITANGSLSFCTGDNVELTATTASSYLWSNGATTQSIIVNTSGTFSVTVTDTNGCSNTSSAVNTIENSNPTPVISANGSTTFCNGDNVILDASGGTSYLWNTGATTASILASQSGTYSFTAYNGTCSAVSSSITVTVLANPIVVANASQTTICEGEPVMLTGAGAVSYTWNHGVTDGVAFNPTSTNTYQVTGIDANGCSGVATITVNINPLPDASFTSNLISFCPGTNSMDLMASNTNYINYDWYESGSPLNINGPSTISISLSGLYELIVTDINGCTNSSSLTISTSSAPSVNISASNNSFCDGSSEQITATLESGAMYSWYLNGNQISGPTIEDNVINASNAGDYMVEVVNSNGCVGFSNTITMNTMSPPVANINSTSTSICPGDSVLITVNSLPGAAYQWLLNGNIINGATGINFYAVNSGNYQVIVDDGCSTTSNTIVINQSSPPSSAGTILGSSSLCAGETQLYSINSVTNATSYNWSITPTGAASISQGQGTTSITVNSTNQNFAITVTPVNDCGSGSSSQLTISTTTSGFCSGQVMFAANNTLICVGNQVAYTNYSDPSQFMGLTPQWNFGAGSTPATATGNGPHTVTYNTVGLKTVTLHYVDLFGNSFANETKTNYVNVSNDINTSPISGNTYVSCASISETYSVIATSGSTYSWSVPPGTTIVSGQGTNSITVNLNSNGGNISVIETNAGGCSGNAVNLTVTISNPVSTSSITGATVVECSTNNEPYSVTNNVGSIYSWSVPSGAVILSGQGTSSITVDFNGNFGTISVTETNLDGCSDFESIDVDCSTNISSIDINKFKIYPNPAHDYFIIETSLSGSTIELNLYDIQGKLVKHTKTESLNEIEIHELQSGVYLGKIVYLNEVFEFRMIKN
ncbi:MAG: LamG-like jellyroll fold domain-containing protein [Flavobacteriales bacterium]